MNNLRNYLQGKKTYLTAVLGVITAWVTWLFGEMSTHEAVLATFSAAGLSSLRAAVTAHGIMPGPLRALTLAFLSAFALCTLSACETTGSNLTFGYSLPDNKGRVDVTLDPALLFPHTAPTGKQVIPTRDAASGK